MSSAGAAEPNLEGLRNEGELPGWTWSRASKKLPGRLKLKANGDDPTPQLMQHSVRKSSARAEFLVGGELPRPQGRADEGRDIRLQGRVKMSTSPFAWR